MSVGDLSLHYTKSNSVDTAGQGASRALSISAVTLFCICFCQPSSCSVLAMPSIVRRSALRVTGHRAIQDSTSSRDR